MPDAAAADDSSIPAAGARNDTGAVGPDLSVMSQLINASRLVEAARCGCPEFDGLRVAVRATVPRCVVVCHAGNRDGSPAPIVLGHFLVEERSAVTTSAGPTRRRPRTGRWGNELLIA